jgi:hypothetical protein
LFLRLSWAATCGKFKCSRLSAVVLLVINGKMGGRTAFMSSAPPSGHFLAAPAGAWVAICRPPLISSIAYASRPLGWQDSGLPEAFYCKRGGLPHLDVFPPNRLAQHVRMVMEMLHDSGIQKLNADAVESMKATHKTIHCTIVKCLRLYHGRAWQRNGAI